MNTLELTCQIGSVLTATDEKFGWLLCHSGQGDINHDDKGWVTKRCLTLLGREIDMNVREKYGCV